MFLQRSYSAELIDDFSIRDNRIDQALRELKIINRFLGGNAVTKYGFREIIKEHKPEEAIAVLDLGGGSSDILKSLRHRWRLNVCNIDLNFRTCSYTKKNSPEIECICGDALKPPFRGNTFDIIHASLFLHHFNEPDIKKMITTYFDICKHAILINDLRRSLIAYYAIKILTSLVSKSTMVKNDAPLSVKRGFIKSELDDILTSAGIKNYKIKRKWAFRWVIIIHKN